MKYLLIFLLVLVVFMIALTLGAQNNQPVEFNYLLAKSEYPLSILLACLFLAGFLLGWAVLGLFYFRLRLKLHSATRKIKQVEKALAQNTQEPLSPASKTSE